MLDFFRSPCCRAPLIEMNNLLKCNSCPNAYPIQGGIPVLLLHEAKQRCTSCKQLKPSEEMHLDRCKYCTDLALSGCDS